MLFERAVLKNKIPVVVTLIDADIDNNLEPRMLDALKLDAPIGAIVAAIGARLMPRATLIEHGKITFEVVLVSLSVVDNHHSHLFWLYPLTYSVACSLQVLPLTDIYPPTIGLATPRAARGSFCPIYTALKVRARVCASIARVRVLTPRARAHRAPPRVG